MSVVEEHHPQKMVQGKFVPNLGEFIWLMSLMNQTSISFDWPLSLPLQDKLNVLSLLEDNNWAKLISTAKHNFSTLSTKENLEEHQHQSRALSARSNGQGTELQSSCSDFGKCTGSHNQYKTVRTECRTLGELVLFGTYREDPTEGLAFHTRNPSLQQREEQDERLQKIQVVRMSPSPLGSRNHSQTHLKLSIWLL
ncbi:hypothetical protein HKD37_02G004877 [Glycine soja]